MPTFDADDDDVALVMARVRSSFWRDYFRQLAFALRSGANGPFKSRINLKDGHVADWKVGMKHSGRPSDGKARR